MGNIGPGRWGVNTAAATAGAAPPPSSNAPPNFGPTTNNIAAPIAPVGANGSPGPYAPGNQPSNFGPTANSPPPTTAGANPIPPGAQPSAMAGPAGAGANNTRPATGAIQAPAHAFEAKVEAPRLTGTEKIAQVGTEWILAGELLPVVDEFIEMHKNDIPPEDVESYRIAQLRQRLPMLIETKLIYVDAKKKLPKEAWPKIQPQVDKLFEETNVPAMMEAYKVGTRGQLEEIMHQHGTSISAQRQAFMERSIASQFIHQQVKDDYIVSHDEALAYYRAHIAEYSTPPRARWEHIRVKFRKHKTKEEAMQLIVEYGNQILMQGAKFADVAKAHSEDAFAEEGGYHDWTTQGSLGSRQLDEVVFKLQVGALSQIIEDDVGFSIVRVLERRTVETKPFTEKQADIKKKIKEDRLQAGQDAYLKKLHDRTPVWTMFDPPPAATDVANGGPSNETMKR
jgi:hypothetical protein